MIFRTLLAASTLLATPAIARDMPSQPRLRANVEKLVSFGTRHSLSSATDPKRGIGAARDWVAGEFARLSRGCGGCIAVERPQRRFVNARAPDGVMIEDVLGVQKGSDPDRYVIVGAHIDSRVTDVMNATADAPGANDDASGVSLVLEAARLLSREKFRANIVYVAFSGEEQGLLGATLLADTAKARGWQVDAMLNNDIVGNSVGQGGVVKDAHVRVFSEGIRASESLVQAIDRRAIGGEDDGPSRALAKTIDKVATTLPGGFDVFVDRRPDRFGRGGDHEPFLALGFPAVRFTVAAENWDRQHQDLRTEGGRVYGDTVEGMDFAYLAKVTAINVATIARLAAAPPAPASAAIGGALSYDTKVTWSAVPGAAGYRVYWRRADAQDWQQSRDTTATVLDVPGVAVDDHFFGVAALGSDGAESIVTFAGKEKK
ncbi:M20/M25/M40 family metallo-hydrolase [Sphingomonas adhaesiva]|uniref:M20/M25/M40 family metallo-hydrolase n=1 Tax=Sphingomonas adhaesiva TaxID=28212 RepID=UPI002FFB338B